jgi:hypothetical protein
MGYSTPVTTLDGNRGCIVEHNGATSAKSAYIYQSSRIE